MAMAEITILAVLVILWLCTMSLVCLPDARYQLLMPSSWLSLSLFRDITLLTEIDSQSCAL